MKIAIVEFSTKNHHSLIYNWLSVAKINEWEIILYTTVDIYNSTSTSYIDIPHNVVLYKKMNIYDFFNMKQHIKKSNVDKIIFLTIQSKFIEFYLTDFFKFNYGITVHNTNVWFIGNKVRKISHMLKGYIRGKIRKDSNFFIVNSLNMYNSIIALKNNDKPLHIMPFSLKRQVIRSKKEEKKIFTTIYPGMLNVQRKSYKHFIQLAIDNPKDKFVVLGAPSKDKESMLTFKKIKAIDNIISFNDFISIEEFNRHMLEADILFSDIVVEYNISDMSEIYGETKDSGISYLMIEYMLPCLLNKDFKNFKELDTLSYYFNTYQDIQHKYLMLKQNNYIVNIDLALESFTPELIAKNLKETL